MKSTIRIAVQAYGKNVNKPVIKIVQPISVINNDEYEAHLGDNDVRDELVKTFLHSPSMIERNQWFSVVSHYPVPFGNEPATHDVTTIGSVDEEDLFYRFKHNIINRMIPYEDIVAINRGEIPVRSESGTRKALRIDFSIEKHKKIEDFFNWIKETGYCSWEEQQADHVKADLNSANYIAQNSKLTLRHIFETMLPQDARIAAFDNTPKVYWDMKVETFLDGMTKAFKWSDSPQGEKYWHELVNEIIDDHKLLSR